MISTSQIYTSCLKQLSPKYLLNQSAVIIANRYTFLALSLAHAKKKKKRIQHNTIASKTNNVCTFSHTVFSLFILCLFPSLFPTSSPSSLTFVESKKSRKLVFYDCQSIAGRMDWDNNQENHQDSHQNQRECRNGINGTNVNVNVNGNGGTNMLYVKVMTDEQLETLRKQIAVYAAICEQLVEMHKTLSAQQDLAGGRLGNLYCDPLMASGGHKITARQRWTPTPVQLQILERIFDQGNGTPSKQKIKEITSELSQHGQISETNVYNWFQNRRARSKRKQLVASSNNAESEVETEVDSLNEKKKPEIFHAQQNPPRAEDLCFQSPEISSELHFLGDDHLTGKMGVPGNYNLYDQAEDYGMAG